MKSDSGITESVWMRTAELPTFPALKENILADVCIVGAGIAGMTTAYHLAQEGKSVVVLDDGPVAGGETGRTTAHLVNALDDRYYDLERLHGAKGARLAAESHTAAIARIESIVSQERIDCDFERLDGYLFVPPGDPLDELEWELEATHRAGLIEVQWVDRAPVASFDTGRCLRFPNQAQFHPLKYIASLASAVQRMGGRIFTQTHVRKIEGGQPARTETEEGYRVTSAAVVVATNTPVNDLVAIHTKQAPYRTYVIGARVPRGSIPKALYWDTAQASGMSNKGGPVPYHYVRLQEISPPEVRDPEDASQILIVGGEDHKTGQAEDPNQAFARLEEWTRHRFPMIQSLEFRWSGQVLEPVDGLAFIGHNPMDRNNVYVATGDSGNGMTHGTIAGVLLTDLILDRRNEWADLYDPSRISFRAARDFAKENLNVAAQYGDWVTAGEVRSPEEISPGMGAVLRRGLHKVAAYRDENGVLRQWSAVCRHLGCIVNWNAVEKTWDCPCHGSRYDLHGRVINGPAREGLKAVEEFSDQQDKAA